MRRGRAAARASVGSVILAAGALGFTAAAAGTPAGGSPHKAPEATRVVGSGAWSYFGDPRAVYAHGKTFLGWVSPSGQIQIATVKGQRVLNLKTLDEIGRDDHNNPSIFIRRDGRVVVFYAPHTAADVPRGRRGQMFYRIARRAYSISSWGPVESIAQNTRPSNGAYHSGFAYPNPIQMKDGKVWLFWRGGSYLPSLSTTTDLIHWSTPVNVVSSPPGQRPYAKYDGDGHNAYMAFTRGHPGAIDTGIFFLRLSSRGGVYRADGTRVGRIGKTVNYQDADRVYRFSRSKGSAWIMDVAHDRGGHPIVLYFRRDSVKGDVYRYAWQDGRRWHDHEVAPCGQPAHPPSFYQGGATLDHEDPSVVYLSRRVVSRGPHEIEIWTTPDAGASWSSLPVTKDSRSDNWRPVSPRGFAGYRVFWFDGTYVNFRRYDTKIIVEAKRAARRR